MFLHCLLRGDELLMEFNEKILFSNVIFKYTLQVVCNKKQLLGMHYLFFIREEKTI